MWDLPTWTGLFHLNWVLALGVIPLALIVAALVFGGGSKVVDLATSMASSIWDGVTWTFKNIFAPGALHIASNGAAIITTLACFATLWVAAEAHNARQEAELRGARDYFKNEMVGFKATLQKTRHELAQCKALVKGK